MFGGNSNPLVDIGISMTLKDKFSGPAGGVLSSWRSLLQNMNTYSRGVQQIFANSAARSASILQGMYGAFQYSAAVQKNAFLTSKMMKNIKDEHFDFLGLAKEINERNPLTAMDITSGQKFMAMAGMTANQIKNAAEPAAQLAAIFDMSMGGKGGTADLLTNIMATFQLEADKASKVADVLSAGTTSANMSMQDLAQSIKYVGANAKMSGMSIEEVTAAIGVLGNYGIQGSMAGTNLGQALNTLNKAITGASEKGASALKAIGLSPKDLQTAKGDLIPIHEMLTKIANVTSGMGGVQKQGILFNLFGQRGLRAIVPLLEDISSGSNKYMEIMGHINKSHGWLDKTTKEYMESPEGKIRALTSAWENFVVSAGSTLSGVFTPILTTLTKITHYLNQFANGGFGGILIKGTAVLVGIRLAVKLGTMMVYAAKAFTNNLVAASSGTNTMASGLGRANVQAAQLEIHLRNIVTLLAAQHLGPGQQIRLWGGYAYRDASGRMGFNRGKKGGVGLGQSFFGPFGMAAGPGGVAARTTAANFGTPLYRGTSTYMSKMVGQHLGRQIGLGVARVGASVVGVGSKVLGFLGGPWGMALSLGISFIPMIWDWISNSSGDKKTQEDIATREAAQRAEMIKAIREGSAQKISIDINGNSAGMFGDGDHLNVDMGGDYVNYSLGD